MPGINRAPARNRCENDRELTDAPVTQHVTKMADEKIEEHSAVLEAKVAVLETRLRNQKRAYEAQLRAQAGS